MTIETDARPYTRTIQAPPEAVFRACTSAAALRDWLCDAAEADPHPGGRVYLWWNDGAWAAGTFTAVEPGAVVAFTWQAPGVPAGGAVRIALAPSGTGTAVTVTPTGPAADAESARRWQAGLENLQAILETGIDLRLARRPIFGLNGGDMLDAAQAARLGVPVPAGLRLGDVAAGMGAQAAGLQKDDVVVRVDGRPIAEVGDFAAALAAHQAGDRVPVVFYRGPAEHTVTVELSPRPAPPVPASLAALAETLRTGYAAVDAELVAALAGVSEAQADFRPAPDAWTVKEVLAHLIVVERDAHYWMLGLVEDAPPDPIYHANSAARVRPLAAVYGTLPALVAELQRSEAVTAAIVAALPAEAGAGPRRGALLAAVLTDLPEHTREHLAEMQRLVAAAGL